ncbi:hypothetical protein GQ53DRAFT_764305 [Thozetella sp. PMI_491]|nr:hypothetical protein GQ53DRAFT_764305 [Thozetella sp. PMI_491]
MLSSVKSEFQRWRRYSRARRWRPSTYTAQTIIPECSPRYRDAHELRWNRQGNSPSNLGHMQTIQVSGGRDEPEVRNFQVYDDDLSASLQPQTPQNLPEARHRSRLNGAYTAATGQASPLPAQTRTTSRRRHPRRGSPSPRGLQTPGFAGLYGGGENTDDAVLFERAEIARGSESGDGDG